MRFCDIGSRFGVTPPVIVAVGLALFPVSASTQAQGPTHPLDGLFATEIETVAEVLREAGRVDDETRLHIVSLHEPPKRDVLIGELGEPFGREAFVVVKQGARTFEAIVDVVRGDVTSWQEIQGVEPNLSEEDMVQGGESIKSRPDWQAAMRRRGITDFEPYLCVAVSPGYYGLDEETGRRVGKAWCYDLSTGASNFGARPVEGLTTLIDLNTYEVIRVIDTGPVPVPTAGADYDEASVGRLRDGSTCPTKDLAVRREGQCVDLRMGTPVRMATLF